MSEQMLTLTTLLHMAVGDIGVILIGKLLMAQTMFMLDAAAADVWEAVRGVLCVLAALLAAALIICILVKLQGIRLFSVFLFKKNVKKERTVFPNETLSIETEEGRSQRKDSGAPAPPAEGGLLQSGGTVSSVSFAALLAAAVIAVLLVKLQVI
ncbi:hypothetical protein KUCAC02_013434, partial [Chaenocephalus aceratus]